MLESLRKNAKINYGTIKGILRDIKPIAIAPLQITKHAERHQLDEIDHYHHRPDIVRLISKPPEGNIS